MNEPARSIREVSRRVIDHELGALPAARFGDAIEHAFVRLYELLSPLVGQVGFQAVLQRALHLTVPNHPWLAAVETNRAAGTSSVVSGWGGIFGAQQATEGHECAVQLFVHVLALLCSFIGEELTFRLIGRMWNGALVSDGRGSQEA
jgi:hypothetical protein